MRRGKAATLLGAALLVALGLAISASPATAEVTHKYLGSWSAGVTQPEVGGVDAQGRVYVWDRATKTVRRFDDEGNPAPFSALGTHIIDGEGGFNCPAVPTDCDRVPSGKLNGTSGFTSGRGNLAVDPRSTGPAAGYIYVTDQFEADQEPPGETVAFDPTGKYVGSLNRFVGFPDRCVNSCQMGNVSVASNGNVFQSYCCFAPADQWAPIDSNPFNHKFVGQIRDGWNWVVGGNPYSYAYHQFGLDSYWAKYDINSFLQRRGETVPVSKDLFGDGGRYPDGSNNFLEQASIDPYTEDVYLHDSSNVIEQWTKDNVKVGPVFGNTVPGAGNVSRIGFHPDGRLFMSSSVANSIAVYSDEVPIPDVKYGPAEVGHYEFKVNARVELAGGPEVTDCVIEWGAGIDGNGNPLYGNTTSCDQATPFTEDTNVTATISGLPTETTFHYRVLATNENGTTPGADRTARTSAVLGLKPTPATDIDRSSATLNGTLDPDGMETTYHFEYGIDTEYDSRTPTQTVAPGSGPVNISAGIDKLQPGRVYHYRIVATNELGTTYSEGMTFQAAGPPTVAGLHATDLDEDSAVINARVNPRGYATTYYFEYGTTPVYGSRTPLAPEDIGSGTEEVQVNAQLEGLIPGVVYYFRVVAENEWGKTVSDGATFNFFPQSCPNEHVRQQTGSNYLPDCRAYELVSPGNAGAVQLFPSSVTMELGEGYGLKDEVGYSVTPQNTGLATSPSRFAFFGGLGAIDGTDPPNSLIDMYVTTRTNTGWTTTFPGLKGSDARVLARPQCSASMDKCIIRKAPNPFGPGEGQTPENAPFLIDVDGTYLGRWPTNLGTVHEGWVLYGDGDASADFSHYAFSSRDKAYAPGGAEEAPGSVYDNDIKARTVTVASLLPAGGNIPRDGGDEEEWMMVDAVSFDGSRILMSVKSTTGPSNLYLRADGAVTYAVSRGLGARFVGMTSDGKKVVFASSHQLTPDDTDSSTDIYVWHEELNGQTDVLVRASQGGGAGNSDECNAQFTPQCDAQPLNPDRGKTQFGEPGPDDYIGSGSGAVYFFSPEQLDPENPGIANQRNLYVWRDGIVKYVATLDPGTTVNRMQISPDGSKAAFITAARLTGYDNEGVRQMYTFDADTGALACASCNPRGLPPVGDVLGSAGGRFMSDDGRAFFTSPDPLVPADTNNKHDVYEFVDGRPQLITNGTTDKDLYAGGEFFPKQWTGLEHVSADGVDVYFSTFATLVAEDINGEFVKFYNARTNGGFPENPGLQPCTAADECNGPPSRAPADPLVSTSVPLDRGQVPSPAAKKRKSARKRKRALRRRAAAKRRRARRAAKRSARLRRAAKRANDVRRAR